MIESNDKDNFEIIANEFIHFLGNFNFTIGLRGDERIIYELNINALCLIYSLMDAIANGGNVNFINSRRQLGVTTLYCLYMIYYHLILRRKPKQPVLVARSVNHAKEIHNKIKDIIKLNGLDVIIPLHDVKYHGKLVFITMDDIILKYDTLLVDYANDNPIIKEDDIPAEAKGLLEPIRKIINNIDYNKN